MNKYKYILIIFIIISGYININAQNGKIDIKGTIVSSYGDEPVSNAVITFDNGDEIIQSDENGHFTINNISSKSTLNIWCPGFYIKKEPVANRSSIRIVLIPDDFVGYSDKVVVPNQGTKSLDGKSTNVNSVSKNDIALNLDDVAQGFAALPGVELISKSGQPTEGYYFNIRGVNTVKANNTPLIVVNGIPYLPDLNESGVIGGFSSNIFEILNIKDIENITILKGSEAALYGSMGSNGVILIETDKAVNLDTKVEFIGQYGVAIRDKKLPLLGVDDYKSLVGNVALTKYKDMSDALAAFPYLKDDPNYYYNFLYNNSTDWQDEIYRTAFITDNVLKIKGGDAIAKYDFSLGVRNHQGIIKNTDASKYYARMNADVNLSKVVTLFTTISFAYTNNKNIEQGMVLETNPLLAAFRKGPLFSPYEKDDENNTLPDFASIRDEDNNLIVNNSVSNPSSVVKDVEMKMHAYDILLNAGLQYQILNNLKLRAIFGLNYRLSQEDIFIPGVSKKTVMPLNDLLANNTVRSAEGTTLNTYYALNLAYDKSFNNVHNINAIIGGQIALNHTNYNAGTGYNTANDFYKTLNNVPSISRNYLGYINKWNWMNYNLSVKYGYNSQFFVGTNLSVDGSSSIGKDVSRFKVYPAFNAAWNIRNSLLKNVNVINELNLRAEYVFTGNSQFTSDIGNYYYQNVPFKGFSGLVRAGVPNTFIKPELTKTFDVGLDLSILSNRLAVTFDYYKSNTKDMIMPVAISSVYGYNYIYDNIGKVENQGVELGVRLGIIQNKNIKWYVGGTITTNDNKVKGIGAEDPIIFSLSDGASLISQVNMPINSFYGFQTNGVFASESDAIVAGKDGKPLLNSIGLPFGAGDVSFVDQNGDGVIDDKDKVSLGCAFPKYYGTFYTNFQYKGFELSAVFGYSKGGKMYNAVRRSLESMSDFGNQLVSVNRRWTHDGQVTDIPRASFGDPMENNRFSDRWIEDASYLKLKQIMLSYSFNLFGGTTVFASGENLFIVTKYLGLDPEISYSYDNSMRGFDYGKLANPISFKLGVKLQF